MPIVPQYLWDLNTIKFYIIFFFSPNSAFDTVIALYSKHISKLLAQKIPWFVTIEKKRYGLSTYDLILALLVLTLDSQYIFL